jgi:hypothetical protein
MSREMKKRLFHHLNYDVCPLSPVEFELRGKKIVSISCGIIILSGNKREDIISHSDRKK